MATRHERRKAIEKSKKFDSLLVAGCIMQKAKGICSFEECMKNHEKGIY